MTTAAVVSRAKAYLKVRHKAVRDAMKELNLDGILLTYQPDLAYLTNFTGDDSIGLINSKDFYLITDFRYQEQATVEAGWLEVVLRENKMADALVERRVWMAYGAHTTYVTYRLVRGSRPLDLEISPLVTYRGFHSLSRGDGASGRVASSSSNWSRWKMSWSTSAR